MKSNWLWNNCVLVYDLIVTSESVLSTGVIMSSSFKTKNLKQLEDGWCSFSAGDFTWPMLWELHLWLHLTDKEHFEQDDLTIKCIEAKVQKDARKMQENNEEGSCPWQLNLMI